MEAIYKAMDDDTVSITSDLTPSVEENVNVTTNASQMRMMKMFQQMHVQFKKF